MKTVAPGGVIGILGGGQLGRMLALAAAPEFAAVIDYNLLRSASGVLVMGGVNLGLQGGGGAGAFVGGLW